MVFLVSLCDLVLTPPWRWCRIIIKKEVEKMNPLERIELNPRVCNGKPVIKGTRIPVAVILEHIAGGEPWGKIIGNYPELTHEDIQAALLYAKASLENADLKALNA
jgi:uncharacterized protein (DUF433 family)